jgi:hypothetical protein
MHITCLLQEGERSTFPMISMIKTRCAVEIALHNCTVALRAALEALGEADPAIQLDRHPSHPRETTPSTDTTTAASTAAHDDADAIFARVYSSSGFSPALDTGSFDFLLFSSAFDFLRSTENTMSPATARQTILEPTPTVSVARRRIPRAMSPPPPLASSPAAPQ